MMHHRDGQETAPQCTDPASLDDESLFEAGWNCAASMEPGARMAAYRALHRTSQHPVSRGFRALTLGDHEAAR